MKVKLRDATGEEIWNYVQNKCKHKVGGCDDCKIASLCEFDTLDLNMEIDVNVEGE